MYGSQNIQVEVLLIAESSKLRFIPDNSLGLFPGIRRDLVAPFRSLVPFFVIGRPALQETHNLL